MSGRNSSTRRFLVTLTMTFSVLYFCCGLEVTTAESGNKEVAQRRQRPAPRQTQRKPAVDYSKFSHQSHVVERKLDCSVCHTFPSGNWKEVRKEDEAFADITEYPEHKTCINCHRSQFFARERPAPRICGNCHVKATPVDTSRYPFPSLGEKFTSTAKATDFVSDFR